MTRPKNPFPGVTRVKDRHGTVRWRYRKGAVDTYLPGIYASAEFRAAYEAAETGSKSPALRSSSPYGTMAWLMEQYMRSARFADLSDGRRKSLRGILDWIRAERGALPFNQMAARHVEHLMAKKTGPVAANNVKKALSILFKYAIKHELCGQKVNPAAYADRRKESGEGFYTWTDEDVAKFLAYHGPGTTARLAFMIFRYVGVARQDAARLGWQNVKDGFITYSRNKTGVGATIEIAPQLWAELELVPRDQMLFITHDRGLPYTPESLGNWFKDQCVAAGLPQCSAHGVRKSTAAKMAEGGATENEIMAFLAHSSPKEAATYTKKADRKRLAGGAMTKFVGVKPEQGVSNPSEKLDKTGGQVAGK